MQTFQLEESEIPEDYLRMWWDVHAAQTTALRIARAGIITAEVDKAARTELAGRGLGPYFTHRLGHGEYCTWCGELKLGRPDGIYRDWSRRSRNPVPQGGIRCCYSDWARVFKRARDLHQRKGTDGVRHRVLFDANYSTLG